MKKYLVLFMCILSAVSFWIFYNERSEEEFTRIREMEEQFAEPFIVPNGLDFTDFHQWLLESAEAWGVNVFRSSQTSDELLNKFILLTNETTFFDHLTLRNGHSLTQEASQGDRSFLSNHQTGYPNQIGQIALFSRRAEVQIAPLLMAYETLMISGRHYAELPEGVTLEDFLTDLVERLNENFDPVIPFTVDEFTPSLGSTIMVEGTSFNQNYIIIALFIIAVIIGVYYAASQTKKMSILKLNGLKTLRIWKLIYGKTIGLTSGSLIILTALGAIILGIIYYDFGFLLGILVFHLLIYGALFVLSLGLCILIKYLPIGQGIKNSAKFVFGLNTLVKIGLTTAVLIAGSRVMDLYDFIQGERANLVNWEASEQYGMFWLRLFDLSDEEVQRLETTLSQDLYPILNEKGAILINASDYTWYEFAAGGNGILDGDINRMAIRSDYTPGYYPWRHLVANPNYLAAFPLYDSNGNVIEISEDDERMILLIPERYKDQEALLLDYFRYVRAWHIEMIENNFDIEVDDHLRNPEIKIIWLQNQQEVFSFNPNVFPDRDHYILDPIIRVVTHANKGNMIEQLTVGGFGALRVKLNDNDLVATYEALLPILQELGIDNELPQLVTINEQALQHITYLRAVLMNTLLIVGITVLTTLALSLQNVMLFFHQYKQKLVIHRVFGTSFWLTYRRYFYYFSIVWLIQVGVAYTMASRFNTTLSLIVCLVVLVIEALLSGMMMKVMENKNKLDVVKGEN